MKNLERILIRAAARSRRQDTCIVYTGQRGPYAMLRNEHGKMEGIHQLSYRFVNKLEDYDGVVRHTCDNKMCWLPEHLIGGTHLDNVTDKVSRNRDWHTLGEDHHNSKLTDKQAAEIVELYKGRAMFQRDIALLYGVHQTLVSAIVRGECRRRRLSSLT